MVGQLRGRAELWRGVRLKGVCQMDEIARRKVIWSILSPAQHLGKATYEIFISKLIAGKPLWLLEFGTQGWSSIPYSCDELLLTL